MSGDSVAATLAARAQALPVKMEVREADELRRLVAAKLRR